MALFTSNLGIDFRQNHLILTFLRKTLNRIRLVDYRIYPLWSEGQKEVQQAQWISLITSFISKHQVNKERVAISIPREKVVVRFIRLPLAAKENLRKVLEYEAPKYTPFDKDEVYFDYQILKEDRESLHLIAVFVRKTELDTYLALLRRIGIRPDSVQIPSAAALNLFFYHEGEKGGENVVLLDLSNPFCEMNLIQGKDWKESFHLSLTPENREDRIVQVLKQAGVNGGLGKKYSFYVYGLDAAEGAMPELSQGEALKKVAPPPLSRIEVGKNEAKPDYIYASIGLPLQGLARNPGGSESSPPGDAPESPPNCQTPFFPSSSFVAGPGRKLGARGLQLLSHRTGSASGRGQEKEAGSGSGREAAEAAGGTDQGDNGNGENHGRRG